MGMSLFPHQTRSEFTPRLSVTRNPMFCQSPVIQCLSAIGEARTYSVISRYKPRLRITFPAPKRALFHVRVFRLAINSDATFFSIHSSQRFTVRIILTFTLFVAQNMSLHLSKLK